MDFHFVTIAIVIVYFSIILYIGAKASKLIHSSEDYFLAGRNLGFIAFLMLIISSVISGMSVLGSSGLSYIAGWPSMWEPIFVCLSIAVLMTVFGAKLYRISQRFKYYTVQDYLVHRFESPRTIRTLAGLAGLIISFIYLTGQFRAISIVLGWLFNIPHVYALLIATVIVTLYVLMGGLYAVANTTLVQGFCLLGGCIIIGPLLVKAAGGLTVINTTLAHIDANFVALSYPQVHPPLGDHAFLTPIFLVSFFLLLTFGMATAPHALNNVLSARKASYFKWGPVCAFSIYLVAFYLIKLSGFAARTLAENEALNIPHPDFAMLAAVEYIMQPGLWALFAVIVLAAVMSTTDRLLLTIGTIYTWDIHRNLFNPRLEDHKLKRLSQIVILITSILAFWAAINPPKLLAWLIWMGIGLMLATYCVPLLAGLYWSRANRAGGIWSMSTGLITAIIGGYVHQFVTPLPIHFSMIGFIVSSFTMVIVSLATAPPSPEVIKETESGLFKKKLLMKPKQPAEYLTAKTNH